MARHVVGAFFLMGVVAMLRREEIERVEQIQPHIRVGILLDRQRCRGMAHEHGEEPVLAGDAFEPAGKLAGDLDEALARASSPQAHGSLAPSQPWLTITFRGLPREAMVAAPRLLDKACAAPCRKSRRPEGFPGLSRPTIGRRLTQNLLGLATVVSTASSRVFSDRSLDHSDANTRAATRQGERDGFGSKLANRRARPLRRRALCRGPHGSAIGRKPSSPPRGTGGGERAPL